MLLTLAMGTRDMFIIYAYITRYFRAFELLLSCDLNWFPFC